MSSIDENLIAIAFKTLECSNDSSFEEAMTRYKWLAFNFHPDRTSNASFLKRNEQKMKDLNAAKKVLEQHFAGPNAPHVASGPCACRPQQGEVEEEELQPSKPTRKSKKDSSSDESPVDEAEQRAREKTAARAKKRGRTQTSGETPTAQPAETQIQPSPEIPLCDPYMQGKRAEEVMRWKFTAACFAVMGLTYAVSFFGQLGR